MIKKSVLLPIAALSLCLALSDVSCANLVELDDLNIISQSGNASNGLRFLDISYSVGRSQADALTNAQAAYANARLATALEWDDLFQAANVTYSGTLRPSDAFGTGADIANIASGGSGTGTIVTKLGGTGSKGELNVWSDPDGSGDMSSTYDVITVHLNGRSELRNWTLLPQDPDTGWFIVSADTTAVPEPSSFLFLGLAGVGALGVNRFRTRRRKFETGA